MTIMGFGNGTTVSRVLSGGIMMLFTLIAAANSGGSDDYSSNDDSPLGDVMISLEQENYQQAINELISIVQEQGESADVLNLLGFSHRKLKKYDDAYDYYVRALAIEPEHIDATEYLGELYAETGQIDKAQEQLDRLYEICQSFCREYMKLKDVIKAAN